MSAVSKLSQTGAGNVVGESIRPCSRSSRLVEKSTRLDLLDRLVDDFSIDSTWQAGDCPSLARARACGAQSLTAGSACLHAAYRLLNVIIIRHSSASNDKKRESVSKLIFIAVSFSLHTQPVLHF